VQVVLAALAGYLAGALIALFLDRLYTGAPVRGPLRLCPSGHTPRALWVGTLGYALVRGRCPCGGALPARLWYLPLLGGAAGAAIALRAVDARHAALVAGFSLVLLAFVGTDFERHLLPNRLMYPALALALALSWAWPGRSAVDSLLGGLLGLAVLLALFLLLPGFGFGDVKLAALVGLLAGLDNTPFALMVGVIAGGGAALFLLLTRRAGRRTAIAYGPYLILGGFLAMLGY
jgi:leader peptidase (prepilin peptidase)/N-methyltransferase